jgi:hypothetical protein
VAKHPEPPKLKLTWHNLTTGQEVVVGVDPATGGDSATSVLCVFRQGKIYVLSAAHRRQEGLRAGS